MLKKTSFTLSFLFLFVLSSSLYAQNQSPALKKIIIDAGHGGKDQGAEGLVTTEAQICLAISKKLGDQIGIVFPDIKTLFTRTTDIIPGNKSNKDEGLRYRADFANQSSADLFISIHCNSAGRAPGGWNERRIVDYDEKVSYVGKGKKKKKVVRKIPIYESFYIPNTTKGTETYIWTAKENSHKEQMVSIPEPSSEEDSSIVVPDDDPTIKALRLLYTRKYFAKSYQFADFVQQEFIKSGRINRGVKQRNEKGIWVLHATGMPSVLIEVGFISNKEEEAYLISNDGQNEIVGNIIEAIRNYMQFIQKQKTDKNTTATTQILNSKFDNIQSDDKKVNGY
ncbi:N-acetylmuramoyl-L-alanine amidase family protein [Flavisolibacter tropicus]|uniref:N-acetylmuramoyl-L-alanine amidase n=1 Tax=Flavisolibacter tropicus TaxID=1492898 RepID=A0A172TQJ5_9BACT|nr:N-acetylmuramoyl-L-alanine amidase [Flavisolibacter tropicus]ANE49154.1 hypothetical protein SY85_00190 [Flavisolibacter tropicus]